MQHPASRDDLSRFLIHLTRDYEGVSAENNLISILKMRKIQARNAHCLFKHDLAKLRLSSTLQKRFTTVCFTEAPLPQIKRLIAKVAGRQIQLQPYGLVFDKDFLLARGASPAIYVILYRTLLLSHFEMSTSEVGSSYTLWKARPVQKEHTMSDNLRRYRAIRDALTQGYPGQPTGTVARHLTTLAALISGIVGSKRTQLPNIAAHVPDGAQPESRVKRFARWLRNDHVTEEVYFVPFTEVLLRHLALQTLVLVIDGSVVGRGCVALMLHVVYKGRALPIAWLVRSGKKGHFPEEWHLTLLAQVQKRIPAGAQVVLLGDGAFDGTRLQHTVQEYHWSYVVRTGSNIIVVWDGERFRCDTVAACIKPGTLVT